MADELLAGGEDRRRLSELITGHRGGVFHQVNVMGARFILEAITGTGRKSFFACEHRDHGRLVKITPMHPPGPRDSPAGCQRHFSFALARQAAFGPFPVLAHSGQ